MKKRGERLLFRFQTRDPSLDVLQYRPCGQTGAQMPAWGLAPKHQKKTIDLFRSRQSQEWSLIQPWQPATLFLLSGL